MIDKFDDFSRPKLKNVFYRLAMVADIFKKFYALFQKNPSYTPVSNSVWSSKSILIINK